MFSKAVKESTMMFSDIIKEKANSLGVMMPQHSASWGFKESQFFVQHLSASHVERKNKDEQSFVTLSLSIYQRCNQAFNQRNGTEDTPRWQVDMNQSHDGSSRKMRERMAP
jgi:ABC-type sulfate transport system substrate-binding protein